MSTRYRYVFTGVIHPERAALNVSTTGWTLYTVSHAVLGQLSISIAVSQLLVVFESEVEVLDLATLRNQVTDAVRVVVDAVGYLLGCGYDVEIVQVVRPSEVEPIVFGVDIPALRPTEKDLSPALTRLMKVCEDTRSRHLQRCLADLREAIRSPKDTGFFCYRGIESLRQYFVLEENISSDKASWERLRTALRAERAEIDYVKDFADPIRHGASGGISDAERAEVFRKTWAIVSLFLDFATSGYPR